MIGKIKKHCFLATAMGVAYLGLNSARLVAGGTMIDQVTKLLPELDPTMIQESAGDASPEVSSDPFRLLQILASRAALEEEAMGNETLIEEVAQPLVGSEGTDGAEAVTEVVAPAVVPDSGVIHLQSTMHGPHGNVAYLNGRLVRCGQEVQGLKTEIPPILLEVAGTEVRLEFDGEVYTMDVESTPYLSILEGRLQAVAAPATVPAVPAAPTAKSIPVVGG